MRLFKNKILIAGFTLFLALFFIASTVVAQTVDKAELEQMTVLEKDLRSIRNSKGSGYRTDQEYLAKYTEATDLCAVIGEKIYTISKGFSSTAWGEVTAECVAARVDSTRPASDILGKLKNRSYDVSPSLTTRLQSYLVSVESGSAAALDTQKADEISKKEAADTTTKESSVGLLNGFLNAVVEGLGNILASVLAALASLAVKLIDIAVNNTTLAAMPGIVDNGWVIIRDLMNIMFILALIVMALATILRRDVYNYRKLLFDLILMALLINFSKVIAETLIGVSDMLIRMFNPGARTFEYAKLIFNSFVFEGDGMAGFLGFGRGLENGVPNVIIKLIGLMLITVAFVAISLLMFVRLVGLSFLIMLSPIAYGLNILPATKQYSKMWWDTFIKYLIWGPVAMFFFSLAGVFMKEKAGNQFEDYVLDHLFIAGFVWAGYIVAKRAGMYGASAITSYADKTVSKFNGTLAGIGKGAVRAGGNFVWRGNAAGVAKGITGSLTNKGTFAENYKAGKEAFGARTARISNEWSLQKQKWIDDPNAARAKLVKTERRRQLIERDYLKDLDETTAKEFTPQDFAHLLSKGQLNENKMNNLMEHGNRNTKAAVAAAFATGKLSATTENPGMSKEATAEVFDKVRSFVWKDMGREQADLADHPDFMIGDNLRRDVTLKAKSSGDADKIKDMSFDEQLKKAYIKFDESRNYRKTKNQDGGAAGTNTQTGTNPPTTTQPTAPQPRAPQTNNNTNTAPGTTPPNNPAP